MNCRFQSCCAAVLGLSGVAVASPIFSQTPGQVFQAFRSDSSPNNYFQIADDFKPTAAATARSVRWRGLYAPTGTLQFPLVFNLTLYGDSGGLPNTADVRSTTTVTFPTAASVTDTGILLAQTYKVYDFAANITATPLAAGSTYWLSVQGDTTADTDDDFAWVDSESGTGTAQRATPTGAYAAANHGDFFFAIDNATVPEPAGLAGAAGVYALTARRRRPAPR